MSEGANGHAPLELGRLLADKTLVVVGGTGFLGKVWLSFLLARFPEGYRHLAYLQTRIGFAVKPDMPGLKGPAVEALYARGAAWLTGGSL